MAILETGDSLSENCATLFSIIGKALEWDRAEGVYFDTLKTELPYFLHWRSDKNPKVTPSVTWDTIFISENNLHPYTIELGIFFDKT